MNEIDLLKRRLERERQSRKQAEAILEEKALELYHVNNELKALNEGLEARITERTSELQTSQSRLAALIANLHAAILVEDENRIIVLANTTFCSLFQIPMDPEMMKGMDCSGSAEQVKSFFEDPEDFVQGIQEVLAVRKPVIDELLYMADGRILERDYIPILFDGHYHGHLWQYRDVTKENKAQENLRRSEEKYRGIIENMELGLLEVD
ncbi:MAG: PAS domain-containing protein, partial [Saprospiraceae bacterium]